MTYRPHRWLAIAVIAGLLTCPLYALDDSDGIGFDLVEVVTSWIGDIVEAFIGPEVIPGGQASETGASAEAGERIGPELVPAGFEDAPPLDEFGNIIIPAG